ncbi:MAG: RDD family protein [Crocinitomicaceae bacterium]
MDNDFAKVMSERSNEELIKIVSEEKDSYQPAALEAAKHEIENRNIDAKQLLEIKKSIVQENLIQEKLNSKKVSVVLRLVNCLVDSVIILILSAALLKVSGLAIVFYNERQAILYSYALYFSVFLIYYVMMESTSQKTVGKYITKTKVISDSGRKANFGEILGRTIYRLIPFDALSYIFVNNGIHDYLSKTTVVKSNYIDETTESNSAVIDDF